MSSVVKNFDSAKKFLRGKENLLTYKDKYVNIWIKEPEVATEVAMNLNFAVAAISNQVSG